MGSIVLEISNLHVTPGCGTYLPGQPVTLTVKVESTLEIEAHLDAKFYRGLDLVERSQMIWKLAAGHNEIEIPFQPGVENPTGYEVEVQLKPYGSNQPSLVCQTAFDVLSSWTVFPRYGFMCDFSPARKNNLETIESLNRYHLNGLQFYDWQYRHDTLLAAQEEYSDPLGRPLSLVTIRELIQAAHAHGMKTMPYLAIYAASAVFWKNHPGWAFYDQERHPIPFGEDFLGIMNPVAGGEWSEHLLAECKKVLEQLPFDGLHIDQYGDPKTGFDIQGQPVNLPEAFAAFVNAAVSQNPGAAVLFNLVGNWPIESLSRAPTAFTYIEIWPPHTTYTAVAEIVRNARQLSGEKPVVIALYLPANRQINNRLVDAMIFSAGGTRIELGENGRLLSDPYFPKHEAMPAALGEYIRRQLELIIRYAGWISPLVPESILPAHKLPEGVEPFFRRTPQGYSLSLVNLNTSQTFHWNEEHDQPAGLRDFTLEIQLEQPVANAWMVTPDIDSLNPQPLKYKYVQDKLVLNIPSLEIWDVILIETLKP